jgi:hypothetical protein
MAKVHAEDWQHRFIEGDRALNITNGKKNVIEHDVYLTGKQGLVFSGADVAQCKRLLSILNDQQPVDSHCSDFFGY